MKKWLQRNKIFFETIVMTSLTLTGIIISLASLKIATDANILVENQINDEEAENTPMFISYNEYESTNLLEYIYIKNTGGNIRYGEGMIDLVFYFELKDKQGKVKHNMAIFLENYYSDRTCNFEYNEKIFRFSRMTDNSNLQYVIDNLEQTIKKANVEYECKVIPYFRLYYLDYKNEEHSVDYEIRDGTKYDILHEIHTIRNSEKTNYYNLESNKIKEFCQFIRDEIEKFD